MYDECTYCTCLSNSCGWRYIMKISYQINFKTISYLKVTDCKIIYINYNCLQFKKIKEIICFLYVIYAHCNHIF